MLTDNELSLTITPIQASQEAKLSALCLRIYPQYYTYLWDDAGAWYMNYVYSESKLQAELLDENVHYYFAEVNGEAIGYLKLNPHKNLNGEPNGFEIERIYMLNEVRGLGIGKQLMTFAFDFARQLQKGYVWLHVMDSSPNSIAFYQKLGFKAVGETWLPFERMLPGYRRMWQMRKEL